MPQDGEYLSPKKSRLKRMVYYNTIGRRVARAVGFLMLLMILAGAALLFLYLNG